MDNLIEEPQCIKPSSEVESEGKINEIEILAESRQLNPESVTPFEMTYRYYNRMWATAQQELDYLIKFESPESPIVVPERLAAVRMASKLYLKYIRVTNKLIECHEHIAHPQKRRLLKKFANACIGRVLELKQDLVNFENSEFHFLDQMLLNLRMLPAEMEIKIPEYFKEERSEEEQEKANMVQHYLDIQSKEEMKDLMVSKKKKFVRMAMVMIRMIQAHERARQARDFFHDQQKKYVVKELNKRREATKETSPKMTRRKAAITIQRAWKWHVFRKRLHQEYAVEMDFLGMTPSSNYNASLDEYEKDRIDIIRRNENEYMAAREAIKQEMLAYHVSDMIEELEDKIRTYFSNYLELFGCYPVLPSEEEGGSTTMFLLVDLNKKDKEAEESEESKIEGQKDSQSDKASKSSPKTNKSDKSSKTSKDEKDKPTEPEQIGYSLKTSKHLPDLLALAAEYQNIWANKEISNFDRYDAKMVEEEVKAEVELQVRLYVDEKMREELLRLTAAHQKDSKKKAKGKGKKGGKKGKKGKEKGKKGKKGKKEKDLTPDRTLESLVEELVNQRIIVKYAKCCLSDFLGDLNYSGSLQHISGEPDKDPLPCLGDIRRVVNEYCILPMGSAEIHSKGAYVKSILLAGPHGVGKKSLVYAICNEIGATLMDISAQNIDGKYPGKEGLAMLMHLVSKVGRLLQPTVIFIKDAENNFFKKKPPTCKLSEPGRLKKELPKFIKSIGDNDRLLLCGTSVLPFDSDLKGLGGCYNKVICIFKPDYNCRRLLWRDMIAKKRGIITKNLDMSVLCNISDGFTPASIKDTVEKTLTDRRLAFQYKLPLCAMDFVSELASHVPVYEEEHKEYKLWLEKMPLRKKRIQLLELEIEEAAEEEEDSEEED